MLAWRLGLSAIFVPALLTVFYFDARSGRTAPLLGVMCLLLCVRSAWELVQLLRTREMSPSFPLTALLSASVVAAGWFWAVGLVESRLAGASAVLMVFALAVLGVLLAGALRFREPGRSMETLGAELIVICYTGLLLAVTAQLRWIAGSEAGYLVLGSVVLAAKMGDTMAYTFGRLFGKRKMAPRLSPGKTWAGFTGALVGSAAAGAIWLYVAPPLFNSDWAAINPLLGAAYGAALGLAGLIGDLCESLIKRDVGQKDAAALMPGFGGLLDLLDSILFAGPVAYVLWTILPLQTW